MPCDIREHEPARIGSDLAAIDHLAGQPSAGAEERVRRATEFQSAPVRFLDQPMPVFGRDAERLFREHMLARGQRRMADLEMRVWRGQIDHDIDFRIAHQRVDGERANAELVGLDPRGWLQNIRAGNQPHTAEGGEVLHVDGRNDSAADDADAKILHRSLL